MPKEEAFCATINGNQVIRAPQLNATPLHWTPLRGTDLGHSEEFAFPWGAFL